MRKFLSPLSSQVRDCLLFRYADRVEIKIPLYGDEVRDKPIVVIDKSVLTITYNKIDGPKQCIQPSGDYRQRNRIDWCSVESVPTSQW